MIYGRLGSLHHRPPPPPPRVGARYVHRCPVRVYVYAYIRVHDGGRRSEWVATVEARVIREFIGACYAYYSSAWERGGENCRSRETSFIISKKKSRCIGRCPTTPAELLSPFPTLGDQCCPLSPDSSLLSHSTPDRRRISRISSRLSSRGKFSNSALLSTVCAPLSVIVLSDFSRGTSSPILLSCANRKSGIKGERIATV